MINLVIGVLIVWGMGFLKLFFLDDEDATTSVAVPAVGITMTALLFVAAGLIWTGVRSLVGV